MKTILYIIMAMSISLNVSACNTDNDAPQKGETQTEQPRKEENDKNTIKLAVGSKTFTATLADNSSTRALKELLAKGEHPY